LRFELPQLDSYSKPVPVFSYIVIAVGAYLLGSIPTGFLAAKARGVDIRTVGSGNIGATNAFRVLGRTAGILVLLFDAFKGFAAPALTMHFYPALNAMLPRVFTDAAIAQPRLRFELAIVAGVFAVLGHNYTCWLKFKGGKGIATTAGVYAALAPLAVAVALGAWIIVALITRYVSLASIAAALALPTAVWFGSDSLLLGIVTTVLGALAILKHRKNVQRLLNGTENRIGRKTQPAEAK
jgi:glycerol-3-phosphate acyltransferase PlsY